MTRVAARSSGGAAFGRFAFWALLLCGIVPVVVAGVTPQPASNSFLGPVWIAVLAGARYA